MKKTVKIFLSLLLGGMLFFPIYAQVSSDGNASADVDEQEIRDHADAVTFQNRSNRLAPDYVQANQIERGKRFAEQVLQSKFAKSQGITIKRILDQENPGLGADVLILGKDSDFGHINGIIRIISGYLAESFEYSQADARMLSNIIVYYNANIRNDLDAVKERYAQAVVQNLDSNTVGIDRYFANWAGQTEIIIPLKNNLVRPGEKDMDTSELQEQTKGDLDKDTDKKFEETRKERREEDKSRLQTKKKEVVKEAKKIEKEKKQVEKEKEKSQEREEEQTKKQEEAQKELEEEQAKPEEEQDKDKIKELEEKKEEAAKEVEKEQEKQKDLEKQEEKIEEKEQENKETAKKIKQQEEDIKAEEKGEMTSAQKDKKIEVLAKENEELKKEQEKQEKTTPNVVGEKILFMRVMRNFPDGHYNNQLWMIDPVNDTSLFRSSYDKICGKDFVAIEDKGILVLGYEGSPEKQGDHKFVLLEQSNLSPKKTGENVIHWLTPMIYKDKKIYAFEVYEDKTYFSSFNPDLTLDKRSSEPVSPHSEVSFYYDKIYITGKSDSGNPEIMVLKKEDLQVLKIIKPSSN